jgi:hypothetical protein
MDLLYLAVSQNGRNAPNEQQSKEERVHVLLEKRPPPSVAIGLDTNSCWLIAVYRHIAQRARPTRPAAASSHQAAAACAPGETRTSQRHHSIVRSSRTSNFCPTWLRKRVDLTCGHGWAATKTPRPALVTLALSTLARYTCTTTSSAVI